MEVYTARTEFHLRRIGGAHENSRIYDRSRFFHRAPAYLAALLLARCLLDFFL